MTTLIALLVMSLATARLTRMIVEDQISEPLRNWAYRVDPKIEHVGYVVGCPYCTGIWAGMAVMWLSAVSWIYWGTITGYIMASPVVLLGIAQAALLLSPRADTNVTVFNSVEESNRG